MPLADPFFNVRGSGVSLDTLEINCFDKNNVERIIYDIRRNRGKLAEEKPASGDINYLIISRRRRSTFRERCCAGVTAACCFDGPYIFRLFSGTRPSV